MEKGKTFRSQKIDDKRLHAKNLLDSSDNTGKLVQLSDNIRVMHAHDGTGEFVYSRESKHTLEEFVLAEHRDTASSNANGEHRFQHPRNAKVNSETITWY